MNQLNKILWGVVLVLLGVIVGANVLGFTDINLFFDGWWTFFIIIPCFIGLFSENEKTGNIIGLIIGIALFLACQDILSFDVIAKLIVPFILIAIGLSLIFNEMIMGKVTEKVREGRKNGLESIVATFSSQKIVKEEEEFEGANLDTVFGGIVLDLRHANLKDETIIKASSIFGGINILVSDDVNIKVKATPIFGGVENKIRNRKGNKKTIYVDAFCLFGGVEIK